jgi:hypothetical protein
MNAMKEELRRCANSPERDHSRKGTPQMAQSISHSPSATSTRLEDIATALRALAHDLVNRTPLTTYPEPCAPPHERMVAVFEAALHGADSELDDVERAYLRRLGPAAERLLAPRRRVA